MTGLINLVVKRGTEIFWKHNYIKTFNKWNSRTWFNTDSTVSEEQIKAILKKRFSNAIDIKVDDISGGCGAMFEIYIETPEFKGLPIVKQHKSVYDALKHEIKQMHGLQLMTKAPS